MRRHVAWSIVISWRFHDRGRAIARLIYDDSMMEGVVKYPKVAA